MIYLYDLPFMIYWLFYFNFTKANNAIIIVNWIGYSTPFATATYLDGLKGILSGSTKVLSSWFEKDTPIKNPSKHYAFRIVSNLTEKRYDVIIINFSPFLL